MNKRQRLESEIASLTEQLKKLDEEEQGQWVPSDGDKYYRVEPDGFISIRYWKGDDQQEDDLLNIGNVFNSHAEAEKYKLRLKSMARKPYLPNYRQAYYTISPSGEGFTAEFHGSGWKNESWQQELYLLGRVFKTEEEAKQWIEKYKGAWEI